MRILFFVSSMNAGGAERVAATLANAWVQRGDEVCLVPTHLGSDSSFYELDPRVQFTPLKQYMGWFPPFLTPVRKLRAIQKMYAAFAPDVVISFLTNVNVNVLLALRNKSTPIFVCERTNPVVSQSADKRLQRLRSTLYPQATQVVMQTEAAAHDFAAAEPQLTSLAVIPNPIAVELENVALATKVEQQKSCRLVAMGRLVPAKQFDQLIQAFAAIAPMHPEWTLHIYGDGPLREQLEQQATELGAKDRVFFPGRTTEPWQVLAEAQLFALTSAYEGFPNVLLEAMSLGLACVTVDCPSGPKELSANGQSAVLVPPNDPQRLQTALADLMADSRLRGLLGQRAAHSVREHYTLSTVLLQWDQLFEQSGVTVKQSRNQYE